MRTNRTIYAQERPDGRTELSWGDGRRCRTVSMPIDDVPSFVVIDRFRFTVAKTRLGN